MQVGDLVFCDDERRGSFYYGIILEIDEKCVDFEGEAYTGYTIQWNDGDLTTESDHDLVDPEVYKGYVDEWE